MPVEGFSVEGPYYRNDPPSKEERTVDQVVSELADLHNRIIQQGGEIILEQTVARPFRRGTGVDYIQDWQILADMPESTSS